jgi:hypothetical protein
MCNGSRTRSGVRSLLFFPIFFPLICCQVGANAHSKLADELEVAEPYSIFTSGLCEGIGSGNSGLWIARAPMMCVYLSVSSKMGQHFTVAEPVQVSYSSHKNRWTSESFLNLRHSYNRQKRPLVNKYAKLSVKTCCMLWLRIIQFERYFTQPCKVKCQWSQHVQSDWIFDRNSTVSCIHAVDRQELEKVHIRVIVVQDVQKNVKLHS